MAHNNTVLNQVVRFFKRHVKDHHHDAADVTVITAESVRTPKPGYAIQTTESIAKSSTSAALKTMGQQCIGVYFALCKRWQSAE